MNRILVSILALALLSTPAYPETVGEALDEALAAAAEETEEGKKGWDFGLGLGASLSYTHNSAVVGAQEGSTFQFGIVLDGRVGYYSPRHEWVSTLKIAETISKTPTIDLFLKTQDVLDLSSTYFYHPEAIHWLGPFARFRLQSAMFPGFESRAERTATRRERADGTYDHGFEEAQEKIDLTSWFEPLTLRQVAGAFARPVERDEVRLEFQLGVGAQEVFTQGGHVAGETVTAQDHTQPSDPDATLDYLQLDRLHDYQQIGADFQIEVSGKVNTYVTWGFAVGLFQPFYSTLTKGKEGFELLEVMIDAKVSLKLASWLSLDYVLSVRRLPLITDEWQVQNALLLTAGFHI